MTGAEEWWNYGNSVQVQKINQHQLHISTDTLFQTSAFQGTETWYTFENEQFHKFEVDADVPPPVISGGEVRQVAATHACLRAGEDDAAPARVGGEAALQRISHRGAKEGREARGVTAAAARGGVGHLRHRHGCRHRCQCGRQRGRPEVCLGLELS